MRLYNTRTLKIEEFKPLRGNTVDMYVCGPTVYNYAHIGNARPIVFFDTLRRILEADGYTVRYVSNFTDVDDKIINKALEEKVPETVIAQRYIDAYEDIRKQLNTEPLYATPRVTQTMQEIIEFIKQLEDNGYAYEVDGDVYFDVEKLPDYGSLSHQNPKELEAGARVEVDSKKHNNYDFALWKKTDHGIQWDSYWGKGRPGWHTECVVMIGKEFNHQLIDIHGGGKDLRFPHHENECAQSEAVNHHHLANFWVHNGMVNVKDQKMSKSLGNVIWAKDVIAKLGGNLTRWFLLSQRYRDVLELSDQTIDEARKELMKVNDPLHKAAVKLALDGFTDEGKFDLKSYDDFMSAMNDDMNTPNAYAVMFKTAGELNQALRSGNNLELISGLRNSLLKMEGLLGLIPEEVKVSEEDKTDYEAWNKARAAKDFAKADELRKKLSLKGIL